LATAATRSRMPDRCAALLAPAVFAGAGCVVIAAGVAARAGVSAGAVGLDASGLVGGPVWALAAGCWLARDAVTPLVGTSGVSRSAVLTAARIAGVLVLAVDAAAGDETPAAATVPTPARAAIDAAAALTLSRRGLLAKLCALRDTAARDWLALVRAGLDTDRGIRGRKASLSAGAGGARRTPSAR
jgi:hypothetical protein